MNRLVLLPILLASLPALAAPGSMIKDDTLRAQPNATAPSVGQAAKGSSVEVLARQAGWTQIKAGGATGWVRVLSVRSEGPSGGIADVGAAFQKRDSGKVVAVAGLRGLSEEELKGARYNGEELARMEQYRVDRPGAQQFAATAGLSARDVPHLPKPESKREPDSAPGAVFPMGGY